MTYNSAMRCLSAPALAIVLVATWPAGHVATIRAQTTAAAGLVELRDVADLQARFNEDRGKTRIVLLVSPT